MEKEDELEKLIDIYNKLKEYYESIDIKKELENRGKYLDCVDNYMKNKLSNIDDTIKYD